MHSLWEKGKNEIKMKIGEKEKFQKMKNGEKKKWKKQNEKVWD